MGIIDVCAPVNSETKAITTSITADALYTSIDAGFSVPSKTVTRITRTPMNDNARPSMIHSIARIRLLSSVIGPNPLMMALVGIAMCATPQKVIIADPR